MILLVLFWLCLAVPAWSQTNARLPLPVEGPPEAKLFAAQAPLAGVLSGLQWPSSGPLQAWQPLWSTLQADGTLKPGPTGSWIGTRPASWQTVTKPGYVVGGFRFLVDLGPGPLCIRQAQVFWIPWVDGEPSGKIVESPVYGPPTPAADKTQIIELRVPQKAVPIGLYGQLLRGKVGQASLIVRISPDGPAPSPPAPRFHEPAPEAPRPPTVPTPLLIPEPSS